MCLRVCVRAHAGSCLCARLDDDRGGGQKKKIDGMRERKNVNLTDACADTHNMGSRAQTCERER